MDEAAVALAMKTTTSRDNNALAAGSYQCLLVLVPVQGKSAGKCECVCVCQWMDIVKKNP